jgi:hypothetical protein
MWNIAEAFVGRENGDSGQDNADWQAGGAGDW